MRHLRTITAADTAASLAMAESDPDTLRSLVLAVAAVVGKRRPEHAEDVVSLAACTVARLHGPNLTPEQSAGMAVAYATRAVRKAYALAVWDSTYGDMTTAPNGRDPMGDTRTHYGAQTVRPDSVADASAADFLHTVGKRLGGRTGEAWQAVVTAWLTHDSDTCQDCHTAGNSVTPRGILAHVHGYSDTDAGYSRDRRTTVAAMRSARPILAALVDQYAPRPAGGARGSRQVDPRTPVTRPGVAPLASGRTLTPGEAFGIAFPDCRTPRAHRDPQSGEYAPCDCRTARHTGEQYGVSTAPIGERDRRDNGQVKAFPTRVSPRKRGSDNGPSTRAF